VNRALSLLALVSLAWFAGAANAAEPKYEPTWESINSRATPKWFSDAKFGIFIHWGVYSVPAWSVRGEYSEWYWNRITDPNKKNDPWRAFHTANYGKGFDYKDFAPGFKAELYDPDFWAKMLARSGAKYVVLTSKHHDGYCLWPNEHANKAYGRPWNSVDAGPKRDLLGDLTKAVRKTDVKMCIYYSLYEWYNPLWMNDKPRYVAEHMHPQFKDVVSRYAPSLIFSDGEWDISSQDWRAPELLAWLFNESPCRADVVINDRWGKKERHKNGGYWTTEYGAGLPDGSHPWEECRGMAHSFGYSRTETIDDYKSAHEMIWILADLVSRGGNLLLDIGPTADGRIPVVMQQRMVEIGDWLGVNGEAIYGSRPWKQTCQWTEGKRPEQGFKEYRQKYDVMELAGMTPKDGLARKQAFFTTNGSALYAILPGWPGKSIVLKQVKPASGAKVSLLGVDGELKWQPKGDGIEVQLPTLAPDRLPCRFAWTVKVSAVE